MMCYVSGNGQFTLYSKFVANLKTYLQILLCLLMTHKTTTPLECIYTVTHTIPYTHVVLFFISKGGQTLRELFSITRTQLHYTQMCDRSKENPGTKVCLLIPIKQQLL